MQQSEVLIVGGGGCGLVLANLLADAGVDFLAVERHPGTSILPKAHYLNQRTMEILRQHGLAAEIQAVGTPAYNRSRTAWYTSFGGDGPLDRRTLHTTAGVGGQGTGREVEYREAAAIDSGNLPQLRLEPVFRQHAEQRAPDRIRFGHELLSFVQDADGVTATIRDLAAGKDYQVRTRYLVGADAGRTVGPAVGISLEGQRNLITQVSVHFEADLSAHYPDDRVLLNWIRSPLRPGVSVIVPMGPVEWGRHSPEWSIGFARMPWDPDFTADNVTPEIRKILGLPDLNIKVRCVSQWNVEGVVASKYQVGRVFVAGDAAHRHPPTTGLGLSTGIQDAHNLAWKLAMVVRGRASPRLLETYATERRPTGHFNVQWALNAFFNHLLLEASIITAFPGDLATLQSPEHAAAAYHGLFDESPQGRMRRARLATVFGTQDMEFLAQDVELGFVYADGALIPDGSAAPERDPMGQRYRPVTRPGHRLPHCWLDRAGARLSTHDFSGRSERFVLLVDRGLEHWQAAAEQVRTRWGIGLEIVLVDSCTDVFDTEGRWQRLREVGPGGAILARPDNVVAWRSIAGVADPRSELGRVFTTLLGEPARAS
jgi:2,4-dichlorophenol 6-monooxygenase